MKIVDHIFFTIYAQTDSITSGLNVYFQCILKGKIVCVLSFWVTFFEEVNRICSSFTDCAILRLRDVNNKHLEKLKTEICKARTTFSRKLHNAT